MLHAIAVFFSGFPPEIAVLLISATPVLEQRVAIPLALLVYHMPPLKTYFLVMAGNIGPVLLLSHYADRFHAWIIKNSTSLSGRVWLKKIKEAQDAFQKYEKYGLLGLMLFVASPLPGSGIFTGAIVAFLMGVPFKHSWPYLTGAVLLSGVMTMVIFMSLGKIF